MNMPTTSEENQIGGTQRFLQFSLGSEEYAIPLLSVKEVIALPEITSIPYTPAHFLGIMNLRGQVISVIDLRTKLNIKSQTANSETCVIICEMNPLCLGVVVDSVNSVLNLRADEISPKPQVESTKKTDYILGVTRQENQLILLCDIAKTLDVQDHLALKQADGSKKTG